MEKTGSPETSKEARKEMNLREEVDARGFAIVPDVLSDDDVAWFQSKVEAARQIENTARVTNNSGTYGLRNLIDVVPEVADLVKLPAAAKIVADVLGENAFMIRATLFDKTPGANWGVFWHQDLSIAVKERQDVEGFDAWTRKAGVHCVQPPVDLMRQVLAVRFHLDDCTKVNGALKVLPGTHKAFRCIGHCRSRNAVIQAAIEEVTCEVPRWWSRPHAAPPSARLIAHGKRDVSPSHPLRICCV